MTDLKGSKEDLRCGSFEERCSRSSSHSAVFPGHRVLGGSASGAVRNLLFTFDYFVLFLYRKQPSSAFQLWVAMDTPYISQLTVGVRSHCTSWFVCTEDFLPQLRTYVGSGAALAHNNTSCLQMNCERPRVRFKFRLAPVTMNIITVSGFVFAQYFRNVLLNCNKLSCYLSSVFGTFIRTKDAACEAGTFMLDSLTTVRMKCLFDFLQAADAPAAKTSEVFILSTNQGAVSCLLDAPASGAAWFRGSEVKRRAKINVD